MQLRRGGRREVVASENTERKKNSRKLTDHIERLMITKGALDTRHILTARRPLTK